MFVSGERKVLVYRLQDLFFKPFTPLKVESLMIIFFCLFAHQECLSFQMVIPLSLFRCNNVDRSIFPVGETGILGKRKSELSQKESNL